MVSLGRAPKFITITFYRSENLLNFLSFIGLRKCLINAIGAEYLREFHLWLYFQLVSPLSPESIHLPSVSSIPISISSIGMEREKLLHAVGLKKVILKTADNSTQSDKRRDNLRHTYCIF